MGCRDEFTETAWWGANTEIGRIDAYMLQCAARRGVRVLLRRRTGGRVEERGAGIDTALYGYRKIHIHLYVGDVSSRYKCKDGTSHDAHHGYVPR